MADRQEDSSLSSSDDSSTISNQSKVPQSKTSSNQASYHYFHIHCLSKKKILKGRLYTTHDDIKNDAFALYPDGSFNDDNAILTYLDNKAEVLLTSVPNLLHKGRSQHLFIRFVHPVCAMCSNPFGIVDSQLLLQCSRLKCGVQYCNSCVEAIQGSLAEHPFACIACKKNVTPHRNMLIEKHIIWKSMCKLYGIQSLLDLKENSNIMFCRPILQNMEFRLVHLQSRFNTLQNRIEKGSSINLFDEQLINDVNDLYIKLKNLVRRIKETDQEMEERGITVSDCLKKYKKAMQHFDRLSDVLTNAMIKLQTANNNITTDTTDAHKERIKKLYKMNNLDELSSEHDIKAIDGILEDIIFRRKFLSSRLEMVTSLLKGKPDASKLLQDHLEQVKEKLKKISIVEEELNYLRESLLAIERYIDEYDKLLQDNKFKNIPYSKFILLLEKMRIRTEELEISNNFPQTVQLMEEWQNDHGRDNEFKPKVIDLFKAVEIDVKHLLNNENCTYSLPYKIGVIGDGSVGKSALTMNLANSKEFSSMIAIERSTFGYLEFDTDVYKDPCNNKVVPITFVDIEGATDTDKCQSIGNYIELINKADCDLYIIVFDRPFSGHNRICRDHIENTLKRKCLLVRNKADLLFNQFLKQATGKKYEKTHTKDYHVKLVLSQIKNHASKTFDDKCLDKKVYLTAAVYDDDLKGAPFDTFDLNKLKKKLVELAIMDSRDVRIFELAVRVSITGINTCFRRGYAVAQTKYRWIAAGASVIPFLDELPAYFGREKIRQAFGIHESCAVTNAVRGTRDPFEEYLTEKNCAVPKEYLKSGNFKYLKPNAAKQTATTSETISDICVPQKRQYNIQKKILISSGSLVAARHTAQNITARTTLTLGVVGKVIDGITRAIVPVSSGALRAVSITGIVVGAVLTPVFAAWSFYSTGSRMNEELYLICDDLMTILPYFIADVCIDCFQSMQLRIPLSSDEDSSSSEDE